MTKKQEQSVSVGEPELVTAAQKVIEELGTSTDGLQELYQSLKLYTTPQPKREPMTRDDLWKLWCNAKAESEYLFWWEFARAIEAAHGIHPSDFKE